MVEVDSCDAHLLYDCGSTNKTRLGKVISLDFQIQESNFPATKVVKIIKILIGLDLISLYLIFCNSLRPIVAISVHRDQYLRGGGCTTLNISIL